MEMKVKRQVPLTGLGEVETEAELTEAQIQQAVQRALTGRD